jgi:DNA transposition AAA+ family ATPase
MGAAALLETGMTLAEQCEAYMKANNLNWTQFGLLVNYARPTVSAYVRGVYPSNPKNIESAIRLYFASIGMAEQEPEPVPRRVAQFPAQQRPADRSPVFIKTADSRGVFGVCCACQEDQLMAVVSGKSGYGKSYSLQQYAKLPRVAYVAANAFWTARNIVEHIESALGIAPKIGSLDSHIESINEFFRKNPGYLLIIDEADKLISDYKSKKLYILQTIFDHAPVGIVLAGLPVLGTRLAAYLPEVANRAIYGYSMQGPSAQEVCDYLGKYSIAPDVLEELHGRARGRNNSCFRLLANTVNAAVKEMVQRGQGTVTMEIYSTVNMLIR